ncbi:hypothetical protein F7P69_29575 [Cellulosimicrobium funkei]|nr:hypothetical protein [Cellulosimicrobium funkei]
MRATRAGVAAFIAGFMALALVAGGGAAWAYWTATAQGTGQVTTPSVQISETNFSALQATYINTHTRLTTTGSFTITNNGSVAGVATSRISAPGGIAPQMPLRIWPAASASACTPSATIPESAASGTWASAAVEGTALAAGASQTFCVRTTVPVSQRDALATTSGTATVAGALNVSMVATGTGWSATANPALANQTTQAIYRLDAALAPATDSRWHTLRSAGNSTTCLEVSASGGAGSAVASATCAQNADGFTAPNQFWQVIPVNEANRTLVTLRPRHAPSTRLAVDGTGRQVIAAANPASTTQQWHVQRGPNAAVQFVSAVDGRCLAVPSATGTGALSMVDCTNPASVLVAPDRRPLTFRSGGLLGLGYHTLIVGPRATGATMTLQRWNGSAWNNVTTNTGSNPNEIRFSTGLLAIGTHTLRLIFADGTVAYEFVLNSPLLGGMNPVSGFG